MSTSIKPVALVLALKVFLLLCCVSLSFAHTDDSSIWPPVEHTTKPWTRWWWPGSAVDQEGLTQQLERFAEAGLG